MAADHGRADVDRARDRSSSGDEQGAATTRPDDAIDATVTIAR
jgi:hypothetical protein